MNYRLILALFISTLVGCSGCRNEKNQQQGAYISQERLIEENKRAHEKEVADIKAFVSEKGWTMTETGTGLRYYIYEDQEGEPAVKGDIATIEYEVRLFDGTLAYSSKESGPLTFRIGHEDVVSGLHEGIKVMSVGDRAKMILPSHLAHGLSGDRSKIPYESPLVYDVELVKLETP